MAVSVNSTRDEPGGRSALPAMPHDTTTRCGGSTARYSPRNGTPLMSTAKQPPRTGSSVACCPIHDTIRSGVTRWANTTSGGASMSIEVEKSAIGAPAWPVPARFCFGGSLEPGEMRRPETVEEVPHGGEAVGAHQEQMSRALAPLGDEARAFEHLQMVGDDLLGDAELQRQLANRQRAITDPREYATPGAVG